ncbi:MAG: homocysteine S-methyltransferase family protein, partial [bacterium]
MTNPFQDILEHQGVLILDGGLATSLEKRGHSLDPHLWSAKMLIDSPEEISAVHHVFLRAGADCITTASYQASYEGFSRFGFDEAGTDELLIRSVTLALDAVSDFWSDVTRPSSRLRPLVAASIGPYGAYLADGSEYDGRYGIADQDLIDFHKRRFGLL